MTSQQYRAALSKLGLTITGAAPLLGLGPRQSQRIAAGCNVPKLVEKVLKLLLKGRISLEDLQ